MTSIIKVNNIQNQCGANIINENSNTITIGASGDTISLASGASQTGFGRTGTVDWQTGSIKTATFTAESGKGYFCNTTGGSFEVDLPAGSAGAIVSLQDYNNTFDTNALTVDPNGSEKINGGAGGAPTIITAEGQGVTFVYIDATVGWRSVQSNEFAQTGESFITATGGNCVSTVDSNFKMHKFTGPGTFTVCSVGSGTNNRVDYMIVAGGGGGGYHYGAGGGGGGFRESKTAAVSGCWTASPLASTCTVTVTAQGYPIVVGAGGASHPSCGGASGGNGSKGNDSSGLGKTSTGGGYGGGANSGTQNGGPGGSGGGAGGTGSGGSGGTGNDPSVSPPQGEPGGGPSSTNAGSGGGGAGGAGTANKVAGAGISNNITGSSVFYSGGGNAGPPGGQPTADGRTAYNGAGGANTGAAAGGDSGYHGNNAGSGIVVIRYKFQ